MNKAIASRIKVARERLGLTQEQVAEHLGVPRSAVSDIESGKREVSAVEVIALSRLFGNPVDELLGTSDNAHDDELVMLRAAEVTSTVRRQLNRWLHLSDDYARLEEWLGERRDSKLRAVDAILSTYEDAFELADDERKRLDLGLTPGHELMGALEERFGVKVFFLPLDDGISGASVLSRKFGAAIVVNSSHPAGRRTFTLAHEYFHLLTRGRIARAGADRGVHLCQPLADGKKDRAEQLADRFAGHLLIPPQHLLERLKQARRADGTIARVDFIGLAQYFGVSPLAVFAGLADVKALPWEAGKQIHDDPEFQDHIEQHGGIRDHEPRRFRRLAIKAYLAEHISRSKLAELLGVDLSDLGGELAEFGAENGGDGIKIALPR